MIFRCKFFSGVLPTFLSLVACAMPAAAQDSSPPAKQSSQDADAKGTIEGAASELNADFVDPDLDVSRWVDRFELESREIYASREEILRNLNLQSGGKVADIGAGTGFFSMMFARAVGDDGQVFAVDISPRFLEHIAAECDRQGVKNLTPVLASPQRSGLPHESVDTVFVCDTYHHFEHPGPTLESIFRAMVPGGQLVVIDFERIPDQSRAWVIDHVRAGKETFRAEIEGAGFEFAEEIRISTFYENYCLRFRKPDNK